MKRRLHSACLLFILLSGISCTVKEERTDCPCFLHVSFAAPDTSGTAEVLGWGTGRLFREKVRIESSRPAWIRPVQKGYLTLSACKGVGNASLDGHQVTVRAGQQSDSLYAFFTRVDATGDLAHAEVRFRKQFATVFLDIRKPAAVVRKCAFLVEGNTCGFDLLDFTPVPGPFRFQPRSREGESIVPFRVPRQSDLSLTVTVCPEGGPAARIPLGELVERLGYRWDTEELQDIYVSVDLAWGFVEIGIAGWEQGETFQLIEI